MAAERPSPAALKDSHLKPGRNGKSGTVPDNGRRESPAPELELTLVPLPQLALTDSLQPKSPTFPEGIIPNDNSPARPTRSRETVIWQEKRTVASPALTENSKRDYKKIRKGIQERLRQQREMRRQLEINVAHTILTNFVRSTRENDLMKTIEKNVEKLLRAHMPEGVLLESIMPHDRKASAPMTMDEFLAKTLQKALNQCFDPDFQLTGDASEKEKELVNLFAPYRQDLAKKWKEQEPEKRAKLQEITLSHLCRLFQIEIPADELTPPKPKEEEPERLFRTRDLQRVLEGILNPKRVTTLTAKIAHDKPSLFHRAGGKNIGGKGIGYYFPGSSLPKILAELGLNEEDIQSVIAKLHQSTAPKNT